MTLASVRRLLASGRCAWVLAWALCLPLAQWAGAVHALQHLQPVAEERDKPAQAPIACDICMVAAAIGGGAPLPDVQAHAPVLLPHAAPLPAPAAQPRAAPPRFYASRAPPLPHA